MPFRHELRVRYAEVDMQQIVFNAHYLTYIDEAADACFRERLGDSYLTDLDMVVKKVEITWEGSATFGDLLTINVGVTRWGTTSYDMGFKGSVGDNPVFAATLTYVSVEPGTKQPTPVPELVRKAMA